MSYVQVSSWRNVYLSNVDPLNWVAFQFSSCNSLNHLITNFYHTDYPKISSTILYIFTTFYSFIYIRWTNFTNFMTHKIHVHIPTLFISKFLKYILLVHFKNHRLNTALYKGYNNIEKEKETNIAPQLATSNNEISNQVSILLI